MFGSGGNFMVDRIGETLRLEAALPHLPSSVASIAGRLNLALAEDDGMMVAGGDVHYLTCGASALNVLLAAVSLADVATPRTILDFGAGAGRVTRWLRAAFPEARISACELREQDVAFCRTHFADEVWTSGTDVAALAAPGTYDLLWAGSVLTHLPERACLRLLDKLVSWTAPGGLVVVSTAGRLPAADRKDFYIHPAGWEVIMRDYAARGFGYADYVGVDGYGFALAKPSWVASLVERNPDVRLVLQAEAVWDRHQDVFAIQNAPIAPDQAAEPVPGGRFEAQYQAPKVRRSWFDLRRP